ncbi:MAG TPA: tRNA pseudouridine synthase B, partial [Firmicutes bacterium]|nr:tRNA pseudouridine synthase B [Bacillota bacterium]
MDIKGIKTDGRVILGPMAGITTLAYREFMKPFGVALSVSEMISDCGINYKNPRTMSYLATSQKDRPVALQLFGFSKENTKNAIAILEANSDFDMLDINLGCPVHKVTKTGAGSAWLKEPEKLYDYMREIVRTSHHPVSAKIRLGWDSSSINVREISSVLEKAGVSLLTVHARTAVQGYSGSPNWEAISNLGDSLSIPLCVSGDIFTPEAAMKALNIAKASYVMVARGGVGNPELITNINRVLNGEEPLEPPSPKKQAEYAKEFALKLKEEKGDYIASLDLRGILPSFFKGFKGF